MRYGHGLVIGKFYPPHRGHHLLIDTAAAQCERVSVLVLASQAETIPMTDRVAMLRSVHTDERITVVGIYDDTPTDFSSAPIWQAHERIMTVALRQLGAPKVEAVFSSETYGDYLAHCFSAEHVNVDQARSQVPISATKVRAGLDVTWSFLHPEVQARLATRVVVLGAESSGTTTLSQELAEHVRARGGVWSATQWVGEYGREHTYLKHAQLSEQRAARGLPAPGVDDLVWTEQDFAFIAARQNEREEAAVRRGSPLLVCDTDAFATTVWERRYVGAHSHQALAAGTTHLPRRDIYLVTDHAGVDFEDDGWRDGEHLRAEMTDWFLDALTAAGKPWVLVTGSREERLDIALRTVEPILQRRMTFGAPLPEDGRDAVLKPPARGSSGSGRAG